MDETMGSISSQKTLVNYRLGKTLGIGAFGKVKLALHLATKLKVAVKILDRQSIDKSAADRGMQNCMDTDILVCANWNILHLNIWIANWSKFWRFCFENSYCIFAIMCLRGVQISIEWIMSIGTFLHLSYVKWSNPYLFSPMWWLNRTLSYFKFKLLLFYKSCDRIDVEGSYSFLLWTCSGEKNWQG